jgi:hypothetical protein
MDWKAKAWLWFTRAAQFWLIQAVLVYLWACIVASKPIGPKDYVRFSYHVIQWQPGHETTAQGRVVTSDGHVITALR